MLIRFATLEDAAHLPRIEQSASALYRAIAYLAWLADGQVISEPEHQRLILKGTVWVAEASPGHLVGFLNAEVLNHELHIWELSVQGDWQQQGIGTQLLRSARQYALDTGLDALSLTTFKNVAWCAPAYEKFGFIPVKNPSLHLRDALDAEAIQGLPIEQRVAMRLPITAPAR
ncbi:GNAT family N-acetyltransferase [Lampropedia aestuarii]|uniref:GNAT family N-acetyltransferase n=1 Tax=Lampropedia aestuarii TaxID=2562762 RepID=A0A4S5BV16_9BURK|nr:GNAT family N-acetyltransferase [Lampropedia aestuarii]MDH5858894.1 GNAT family N-acetyltransferase [Lampropedia aestuarii]THJ35183.1 GNAT family N-acetyltransferase [Lampropedia aestuarii]